jgi:hypothetical protein
MNIQFNGILKRLFPCYEILHTTFASYGNSSYQFWKSSYDLLSSDNSSDGVRNLLTPSEELSEEMP